MPPSCRCPLIVGSEDACPSISPGQSGAADPIFGSLAPEFDTAPGSRQHWRGARQEPRSGNPERPEIPATASGHAKISAVEPGIELVGSLPPGVREMLELIAERMDIGVGPWRLEVEFEDGAVRRWFRHEGPLGGLALARFDRG